VIKKIFEIVFIGIFVMVALIIVVGSFLPRAEYELYTKFLNLSHENREIYINGKKIDKADEVFNGLKHLKDARVISLKGTKGGCINIKIISKDSGMSICITDSNYHYFYVDFQRFYLKDSGWQPLYIRPGTLAKKYLRPYIKEVLTQSSSSNDYNDYNGDLTDKEVSLKLQECQRKKDSEWKIKEGDYNLSKEVCEIMLDYLR